MNKNNVNIKDFLSLTLDRCMTAAKARSASIFLLDKEKQELVLEISRNTRDIELEGTRQRLGENVAGKVAMQGRPVLVKDTDTDPFLAETERKHNNYRSKSFLSVPVEFMGNLLGVLNLTEKDSGQSFNDQDLSAVVDISKGIGFTLYGLQDYLDKQQKLNQDLLDELKSLKKSIEEHKSYSSIGRIVGNLVHELNNPLDGVMRYVNLAYDCAEENSVVREYLGEARSGLTRIAKIIRSLLDFSWTNSRKKGTIDLNLAIMESIFTHSHIFVCSNIEIKKYLEENLPQVPDYGIHLVWNNLIKNACDAMPDGGILTVKTCRKNDSIEISISDTGKGISPDIRGKIFEPFFTTKKMGQGTGIGLAVCSEIIQRYRGSLSVESEPDRGSTFFIGLPLS